MAIHSSVLAWRTPGMGEPGGLPHVHSGRWQKAVPSTPERREGLRATQEMAAHQAPLPLGFSRQEHWSGLPFPSLMYESER